MTDEIETRENHGHHFETYGPFPLNVEQNQLCSHGASWWNDEIESYIPGLSSAIGCYMFTMGEKKIRPWYIGKTVNKDGFRGEVFTPHKMDIYNWVIESRYRGPPKLYFFPKLTRHFSKSWRFCKGKSHDSAISWLEKTLMGMAYSQNQSLANSRDVTYLRTVHVRGLLGKAPRGKRHGDIPLARQALLGEKQSIDE